ncbi:MAG: phytanoyl-CoA dioxygenase family protein, partial [bacterium]|nr:phytanoyl-CoA dioxygenase family protein [bacterium]
MADAPNADGLPAVELTDEQKYLFDTRGWLCIPGVLGADEIEEMRAFAYQLARDPKPIPDSQRSPVGGPLQRLTDHPVLVGFMNEFLAYQPLASDEGYGFRLEGTFLTIRPWGPGNKRFTPHGGSGMLNFPGNHHTYHVRPGKANSGLTRAVWELNPIVKGDGGTLFLTGSHKAAFERPGATNREDCPLWDTYECPAGSVLFFTEAITHSGVEWKSTERERCAIFNCYNTIGSKWHSWEPPQEVFDAMPPKRQTLFRPVYCQNNTVKPGDSKDPGNAFFPRREGQM